MRIEEMMQRLMTAEVDTLPLEQRYELAAALRATSAEGSQRLERHLLAENAGMRRGLLEARGVLDQLESRLRAAASPPWFPAIFLGIEETARGRAALVSCGGPRRVVAIADDGMDPAALKAGDEVLLSETLNVMLGPSPYRSFNSGETASFERLVPGGRLLLRCRDEEIVALPGGGCDTAALRKGDRLRFDRSAMLAMEGLPASTGEEYFLEDTPVETFEQHVGGLDHQVAELRREILTRFLHPETSALYGAGRLRSVLLEGPTGNGKTLVAKALANLLARLSGTGRCSFAAVKPGQFGSMYYSETERLIRAFFGSLRSAAARNPGTPIVAFLDEVDGIAGMRSDRDQRHYAEITNSLLAELDGFEEGTFLVVSATNRLPSLDPAARRRLGDLILRVPRPRRASAAGIFRKHLSLSVPYAGGAPAEEARERLIEAAVAAIYAPNGDNHVCDLVLRGGGSRKVAGKDLISGAEIKRIVSMAAGEACRRDIEFGERGLRLEDMLYGVDRFLESAGAPLTPANCRNYLDLEDDVDVVKIERPARPAVGAARLRVA